MQYVDTYEPTADGQLGNYARIRVEPVCQCSLMDPLCVKIARHDPDGSGEPYLCDSCERRSRGLGGEERAAGVGAGR
jgi:predicted SprT family Zn-dependent metalloprotease